MYMKAINIVLYLICAKFIDTKYISSDPIPPQPSQYSAVIILNGRPTVYYADTTIQRDRLDQVLTNSSFIIDFKTDRQYVISRGVCSWSQIPGKIKPLLSFETYQYEGKLSHNSTMCNKWTGCHNYEIPPAPFDYFATVINNIPMDLNLPTVDVSMHFSSFTFGPSSPNTFDIPTNCTQAIFGSNIHPIFQRNEILSDHSNIFC